MATRPFHVLMVEDDEADVDLTREALEVSKIDVKLDVVTDGEAAIDFLRKRGRFTAAQRPDLILLDLNLPKKDGRQVLQEIKSDPLLKSIPVAVLTTSKATTDVARSYAEGANCYIPKPVGFEQFVNIVKQVEAFWFTIVRLPSEG